MVNACLAYGIVLSEDRFMALIELYSHIPVVHDYLHPGGEDSEDDEEIRCDLIFDVFVELETILGVVVSKNGACCSVNERYPYFIGWRSFGERSSIGSFVPNMIKDEEKKKVDDFAAKFDKEAEFRIMNADCDNCS